MNTYALIVCSCPATGRAPTLTAAIAITTKIVLSGPRMLHWTYVGGIERALSGILASAPPGTRRHARHAWRTSIPGRRGKRGPGRDWRGDIFACWNDVGVAEKRLGNVHQPMALRTRESCQGEMGPFEHGECRRCPILPICMGGCPAFARDPAGDRSACLFVKHRLADYLNLEVLRRFDAGRRPHLVPASSAM